MCIISESTLQVARAGANFCSQASNDLLIKSLTVCIPCVLIYTISSQFYLFTSIVKRKSYKTTCVAVVSLLPSYFIFQPIKLFMMLLFVSVYVLPFVILKERFFCFDKAKISFKKNFLRKVILSNIPLDLLALIV